MNIKLSKEISLPLDVVTQTIAILAKKRAGKSYTMRKIVEQLLGVQQQVVIVDPKGDQWGIRSSADGKKPGYPVLILGGEHGDLPLEVNGGEVVANLVVEERVSVLLDLSSFRKSEIATFMAIFMENLYRLKAQEKYRTPMMLVIDEADAIAPQKPQANEARMLGAADDIVRRGGQRGIGTMLVTQRSAVLNKNLLTQSQMLVVLRTISPQDLSAMKSWIDVHGTVEEGNELIGSLPSLPIGDAYFWSPGWPTDAGIFKRTHVDPITTFDSGATPKPGQKIVVPKNLADVDLAALKGQMAAVVESKKQNDPKALKAEIARLTKLVGEKPSGLFSQQDIDRAIERAVSQAIAHRDEAWHTVVQQWKNYAGRLYEAARNAWAVTNDGGKPAEKPSFKVVTLAEIKKQTIAQAPAASRTVAQAPAIQREVAPVGDVQLKAGARTILFVLASRHPDRLTRAQIGTLAGFKPSGGTFGSYISVLKVNGLITVEGDSYGITGKGMAVPLDQEVPQTPEERREMWKGRLKKSARDMFDEIVKAYPEGLTKEELGQRLNMIHTGGTFGSYLSVMRTSGLIKTEGEVIKASEDLF